MKMKSHIVTPEYHIENENTDDERLLLQMTRDGDVNAFNRLFNKYWKKLYRIAYSKVGSREEAEEIVQDIFIKIWEKKSELNIHNLSAYLYTSVKNRCLNYIEKKIIEHKHWEYYKKFIIDYDDSTNKTIVFNSLMDAIQSGMEQMSEKTKQVFKLNQLEGRSIKEIAEIHKLYEKAIEYHITSSIKKMRMYLKEFVFPRF